MAAHFQEVYSCGHIGAQCRCPGPKVTRDLGVPCPACEQEEEHEKAIEEVAGFDFNKLHGLALEQIASLRRSGVPEDAVRYLITNWLAALVTHFDLSENLAHGVFLVLDDDKAFC